MILFKDIYLVPVTEHQPPMTDFLSITGQGMENMAYLYIGKQ